MSIAAQDLITVTLDDMPFGQPCRVAGYDEAAVESSAEHGTAALRLMELGFDQGVLVVKRHAAPVTKDPVTIEIGTHMVAMRRADARLILVMPERA